jgi:drug/metabolite transporter (DMT)-like permease
MKQGHRMTAVILAVSCLLCWSVPSFAADSAFREVFEDSLYGGLSGALVGAAIMAFTHKPGQHLDYIYYGGAGGVLVGAGFGLVKATRSLAEVEDGKVRFAIPTVIPEFQEASSRGGQSVAFRAELLRGTF